MYTLGTAAKAAGVSKSTIHRAIKRGTISVRSKSDGGYEIDPAELHRVFPPAGQPEPPSGTENGSAEGSAERYATSDRNGGNGSEPRNGSDHAMELRLARVEAELAALKHIVEVERKRAEELREERNIWREQAQRLTLPAPATTPAPVPEPVPARRWWWWRRAG